MESYSATVTCLIPNGLLTPKDYKYIIHIKWFLVKVQNHFSQDLLFIGCDIFSQVMVICLHLIKHVPLGFKSLCSSSTSLYSKSEIVGALHETWNCYVFIFHFHFLKIYIFEVATFYLTLQWSNQLNFCSGGMNLLYSSFWRSFFSLQQLSLWNWEISFLLPWQPLSGK